MTAGRTFKQRSAAEIREAAAKLCERMAREQWSGWDIDQQLLIAAKRIRRIPLAGLTRKVTS